MVLNKNTTALQLHKSKKSRPAMALSDAASVNSIQDEVNSLANNVEDLFEEYQQQKEDYIDDLETSVSQLGSLLNRIQNLLTSLESIKEALTPLMNISESQFSDIKEQAEIYFDEVETLRTDILNEREEARETIDNLEAKLESFQ